MFLYPDTLLAAARSRMSAGKPYYGRGTASLGYLNAPADGARIDENATQFLAQPLWAGPGKGAPLHASVWIGYPDGRPDTGDQYPTQHLEFAKSAAFKFALDPVANRACGLKVREALLTQLSLAAKADPASRSTFLPNWQPAAGGSGGLVTELASPLKTDSATQEAAWLTRFLFCFDCIEGLLSQADAQALRDYILAQVRWLAERERSRPYHVSALYPKWLSGDFSAKGYLAQQKLPAGVSDFFAKADPNNDREAPYAKAADTDGYLYTHRTATGGLGYRIAKAHQFVGHNRFNIRMLAVLYAGAKFGVADLYEMGKNGCKLFLVNNVYPDGTTSEWLRNGDYAVPAEGALSYQAHNSMLVLMGCHCARLKGDESLHTWTTIEGCHGTQVPTGGKPKSFRLIFDRFAALSTGTASAYWGSVLPSNRLAEQVPARSYKGASCRAEFLPHHRYLLFWAYRFWPVADWLRVAKGQMAGQLPMPVGDSQLGFRNNGVIPNAFEGAYAEFVGQHILWADTQTVPVYPAEKSATAASGS